MIEIFSSEFAGRDGDQQSDGADDASLTEGYDSYYGYYGDDGNQNTCDWANYNGMDTSYVSMSSEGYGGSCVGEGEEYDHFGYYNMDMTGTSMENYYLQDQDNSGYVASSEAELKEMIKGQM